MAIGYLNPQTEGLFAMAAKSMSLTVRSDA